MRPITCQFFEEITFAASMEHQPPQTTSHPSSGPNGAPNPVLALSEKVQEALQITIDHCNTSELQHAAVRAVGFKCDVLWSLLDSIQHAYGVE